MGGGGQITEGLVGRWRGLGFVPSKLVFEQVSDMTRFHFYRTIVAIVRVLQPGQGWEQMDPLGGCCGKPSERQRGHSEPWRWQEVVGFSLYWKKKKNQWSFLINWMWREQARGDIRMIHSLLVTLLSSIDVRMVKEQLDVTNHVTDGV